MQKKVSAAGDSHELFYPRGSLQRVRLADPHPDDDGAQAVLDKVEDQVKRGLVPGDLLIREVSGGPQDPGGEPLKPILLVLLPGQTDLFIVEPVPQNDHGHVRRDDDDEENELLPQVVPSAKLLGHLERVNCRGRRREIRHGCVFRPDGGRCRSEFGRHSTLSWWPRPPLEPSIPPSPSQATPAAPPPDRALEQSISALPCGSPNFVFTRFRRDVT